jgi:hypothetical protein
LTTGQQQQRELSRPAAASVAGIFLIGLGICGFIDSYLILASLIVWGWLIVGGIGLFTLIAGISLLTGASWGWGAATSLVFLNFFIGFIEIIGAFNYHYAVLGWVGVGQAVGAATLILSAVSLYLLYRHDVRAYYEQFYYYDDYDTW